MLKKSKAPKPSAPRLRFFCALFFFCLSLSSCAYLKKRVLKSRLDRLQDRRAENLSFRPPPPPYKEEPSEILDRLYRSETDQSSISYFSSCAEDNRSLSLKEIRRNVLSGLPKRTVFLSETASKEGLQTRFQTESGGRQSLNSLLVFKRGPCFFTLNFVAGNERVFKKNKPLFDNFIKNFEAF